MLTPLEYPVVVEPLPSADGGGFVATVPDLPGCMSDGDTPEEALNNVRQAIAEWIATARELDRAVPLPTSRRAIA